MVIADEIATAINLDDILQAKPADRALLFPDTLDGLNALVFGLVGAASTTALPSVIETMEQLRHLADQRSEPIFKQFPLTELSAFGFEMLLSHALNQGWEDAFTKSPAYARYVADRQAHGLD